MENQCIVCCEGINHFSVGGCNHRHVCHLCSLRMRALYKNNSCSFCKVCVFIFYFLFFIFYFLFFILSFNFKKKKKTGGALRSVLHSRSTQNLWLIWQNSVFLWQEVSYLLCLPRAHEWMQRFTSIQVSREKL